MWAWASNSSSMCSLPLVPSSCLSVSGGLAEEISHLAILSPPSAASIILFLCAATLARPPTDSGAAELRK